MIFLVACFRCSSSTTKGAQTGTGWDIHQRASSRRWKPVEAETTVTNLLDHPRELRITLAHPCEEKFGQMTVSNDRGQTLFIGATCDTLEFLVPAQRYLLVTVVAYRPDVVFSF